MNEDLKSLVARMDAQEQLLRALMDRQQPRPTFYVGDNRILTVTRRGERMYLDARDIAITTGIACFGGWEENTAELLERFLKPGMIWADIGANCGYFTVIGHRLVRKGGAAGMTYAFEVSPSNFRLCVDNLALTWQSEGAHVEHAAVYSENRDQVTFNIFGKYGVNSGLGGVSEEHAAYYGDIPHRIDVQAVTLDSYFESRTAPQFIKIDIEGGEYHALCGARRLVSMAPDLHMLMEWSPAQLSSCGTEPRALAELIPELGLSCFNAEANMAPLSVSDCLAMDQTAMFLLSRTPPA